MTGVWFLLFVGVVASLVVVGAARFLSRAAAVGVAAGLLVWLVFVEGLGAAGILGDAGSRPPGMVFVLGPVVLFIVLGVVRGRVGLGVALAVPLPLLAGAQVYRVGVELFLHRLWVEGLAPRMLTFAGANWDMLVGVSAPVVAWFAWRGWVGGRGLLVWNGVGLVSLANVVVRSALTAPGPLHVVVTEVPNRVVGSFPYMAIPGFLAPLAVVLHVLAIRALLARGGMGGLGGLVQGRVG